LRSLAALDDVTDTRIQVNNSSLALLPSRYRAHAMLARHKRQRIWLDIIREVLPYSSLSPERPRLEPRLTTIMSSASGGPNTSRTAGESIITTGIPEAMATGPEFVGPTWSIITYSLGNSRGSGRRQDICQTLAQIANLLTRVHKKKPKQNQEKHQILGPKTKCFVFKKPN
jgi:hypothetical protein